MSYAAPALRGAQTYNANALARVFVVMEDVVTEASSKTSASSIELREREHEVPSRMSSRSLTFKQEDLAAQSAEGMGGEDDLHTRTPHRSGKALWKKVNAARWGGGVAEVQARPRLVSTTRLQILIVEKEDSAHNLNPIVFLSSCTRTARRNLALLKQTRKKVYEQKILGLAPDSLVRIDKKSKKIKLWYATSHIISKANAAGVASFVPRSSRGSYVTLLIIRR